MTIRDDKHYCDLCKRKLPYQSSVMGDKYFSPIGYTGSLFKTSWFIGNRLGDIYQEICKTCANAIYKVIKERKKER